MIEPASALAIRSDADSGCVVPRGNQQLHRAEIDSRRGSVDSRMRLRDGPDARAVSARDA